jgi:outer membrane lipoprotein-sorting protein
MEGIDKQIETIKEKLALKRIIEERIEKIELDIRMLSQKYNRQLAIVYKEYEDIENLEEKSTSFLFNRFLNDKQQQLEKERQEYLMAVLLLQNIKDEEKIIQYEKDLLLKKLEIITETEEDLCDLLELKETKLHLKSGAMSETLNRFNRSIDIQKAHQLKITQSKELCETIKVEMKSIFSNLKKVAHWGYFAAGGAGSESSYQKRKYIDNNRQIIAKVNTLLTRLTQDLDSIYSRHTINVHIQDYENFVSIFYDHLITDWILQRKMVNAIQNISQNIDKLQTTTLMLEAEFEKCETIILKIKEEKRLYLLNL